MKSLKRTIIAGVVAALAALPWAAPARAQFAQQATWGVCAGTANAQTMTLPNVSSYADLVGVTIGCIPANSNTGSATLRVNGLSNTLIKKPSPTGLASLSGGEINGPILYFFDGTQFVIPGANYSQVIPPHNSWSQTIGGSYTFTVPTGVYWVDVTVVGGGGGGGPGGGGTFGSFSGGGGGSGGTAEGWVNVSPGQNITVVVGSGGVGSAAVNTYGATGGTSSFLGLSATGGTGAILNPGTTASGGAPGSGSGGQINLIGANGGDGNPFVTQIQGGAGAASSQGGGGRTSTVGDPGRPDVVDGVAPGSGGGGLWGTGTANQQGGKGADGSVYVTY
jgi:hypothetical protein